MLKLNAELPDVTLTLKKNGVKGETIFNEDNKTVAYADGKEVIEVSWWIFTFGKYKSKLKGKWSKVMPYYSGTSLYA